MNTKVICEVIDCDKPATHAVVFNDETVKYCTPHSKEKYHKRKWAQTRHRL